MYLQVVHYYDPRAQTPAATVHALVPEGSTENPVREKPVERKHKQNKGGGGKKCELFILNLLH